MEPLNLLAGYSESSRLFISKLLALSNQRNDWLGRVMTEEQFVVEIYCSSRSIEAISDCLNFEPPIHDVGMVTYYYDIDFAWFEAASLRY
jgi:hypothetical protein